MSLNISKLAKSLIEAVHGIPEAHARKERAEASMKEIEVYERCLKLLKEVGFSEKEIKTIVFDNQKIIENIKRTNCFAHKGRGQFYLPPSGFQDKQKTEGK